MNERVRILLIDDDEDEYILLKELVSGQTISGASHRYDLDWVSTYEEAIKAFSDCQYDLCLVDYQLGSHSGLDLLRETVVQECSAPVIMLTGQGSYDIDLSAMELGAADYLEKSELTLPLLERSIRYAIERTRDLALMKKQAQELAALQKATSSLLQTLELSHLMGQILDAAQEAIPTAEQGRLHLIERSNDNSGMFPEISLNDPRIHRIKLPPHLSNAVKTIIEGQSLSITDLQNEPTLLSLLNDDQEHRAARSTIVAPLVLGQDIFGALSLSSSLPSNFSEADLQLLTAFAATATAAIHNSILYKEIQNLAATDPLTGQLNRRTFFELAQREINRFQRFGRPLSWIMFDIDLFKEINDRYGHSAGDQILVGIADRCCDVIRHVDVFGRYGGDEFVILLPETDHQMAQDVAERIRLSVSQAPILTDAGPISVSISIGITQVTAESDDIGLLLNRADQALYKSKRAGRNIVTVLI